MNAGELTQSLTPEKRTLVLCDAHTPTTST
jgi:hypothetical protein